MKYVTKLSTNFETSQLKYAQLKLITLKPVF